MSSGSEQDRVRELAERVARRLSEAPREQGGAGGPGGGGDIASLRASLAEIQKRLAHVESHLAHDEDCADAARQTNDSGPRRDSSSTQSNSSTAQARPTWLSGTYVPATAAHPSQEQFEGLGEAVSELVEFFEREKTCTVEPGGKPCDHCGMCSARGF
jgi:hypothetical protein